MKKLILMLSVVLFAALPVLAQGSSPAPPPANTAPAAQAQPSPGPGADPGHQEITKFRADVSEVSVIFTVTDKHGHYMKDLKLDDFRVLDDGKPPASVKAFQSETNLPLRAGLLIDSSNSIRDRFRFEQEAATEFLHQIIRPKSDLAFVMGFDVNHEVQQDFTDDTEKLARGIGGLRPGGGTALFDAIYYACKDEFMGAHAAGQARRAIILLSDGDDNQSMVSREEAVEMAQRAEVIIYAISTNISDSKTRGDKVLERFAEMTGGRVFYPYKLEDVSNAFSEIQDELRSQYAIIYKPANFISDGHYRSILLEPAKNKSFKVRARKGYFSPRP